MDEKKELEERFREAASIGDQEGLAKLLQQGVDINTQNHMNGWYVFYIKVFICLNNGKTDIRTCCEQQLRARLAGQSL